MITVDDARFYIATVKRFLIWNTTLAAREGGLEAILERGQTGLQPPNGPTTVYGMWTDLLDAAMANSQIRSELAQAGMFEFVLANERLGALDDFVGKLGGPPKAFRLILLQSIYDARVGTFFSSVDQTGVVTWIQGINSGLTACVDELVSDHTGNATRGTMCRIIADLAIPEQWAKGTPSSVPMASPSPSPLLHAVDGFLSEIATLDLPASTRGTLVDRATSAKSRLIAVAGGAQSATPGGVVSLFGKPGTSIKMITLPDGSKVNVVGGKPAPWYRQTRLLASIGAGVVAGTLFAAKAAKAR